MRWPKCSPPRALVLLAVIGLLGCDDDEELRVSGDHAYVRCLAAEPPEARRWEAGSLRFALEGRSLRIDGAPADAKIAVFTGPVDAGAVRALREDGPALALMLGRLGASEAEVTRGLSALAALGAPVLFVAGGADGYEALEAFDALEGAAKGRLIDVTTLRSVRIGALELVPVAGAPDGRYARSDGACGIGERDVEAIADAVDEPEEGVHRVLLTWAAPSGTPLARGLAAVDAGSPLIAGLLARVKAEGVVAGWPREHAGEVASDPFRAVAPPLAGPWIRRPDGRRVGPRATVLKLSNGTLAPP